MTSTNIARATALRTAIDAIFVQPNKKTLRQSEALAVLAKIDGARNANVVLQATETREPTLGSMRQAWLAAKDMRARIAIRTIVALACDTDGREHPAAIKTVFETLDWTTRNSVIWHGETNKALKAALLSSMPGRDNDILKPYLDSHEAYLAAAFDDHCRDAVMETIWARIESSHPGLFVDDAMTRFAFEIPISEVLGDLDMDETTATEAAERIVMPGTWTLLPGNCASSHHDPFFSEEDLARYARTVEKTLGTDTETYLTTPRADLSWIDLYLLAWVQHSMGFEGVYFEGTAHVKEEERTFEFFFGT